MPLSQNEIHKLNILLAYSQDESKAARILTARALGSYLGRPATAAELSAEIRGGSGKPFFPAYPDFHYNISHSGGIVTIGTSDQPLGIDLQKIPDDAGRAVKIARHFFSKEEQDALLALRSAPGGPGSADGSGDHALRLLFTRFWTARESFIKMTGRGLAEPFENFRPDLEAGKITATSGDGAFLLECEAPGGFCICVSTPEPVSSCKIQHIVSLDEI